MRRLYLQIYLTVIATVFLFLVANVVLWTARADSLSQSQFGAGIAGILDELLPDVSRPPAELQASIDRLARDLDMEVAVLDQGGAVTATTTEELREVAHEHMADARRFGVVGGQRGFRFPLSGDRLIVLRRQNGFFGGRYAPLVPVALLAMAVAVGALPLVRRITRRLERLQERVTGLTAGDLSSRVEVQGKDEIASLARGFNEAADRIERLVDAQRTLLRMTSHEFRTPLTRMRLAVESLEVEGLDAFRRGLIEEIAELDELVTELLLASRLDTHERFGSVEPFEVLALVAVEGARVGATTTGNEVLFRGDRQMFRRLTRNLFENARRYGAGQPIEAVVEAPSAGCVRLTVSDRGPGIRIDERDRVFEPFYRSPHVPPSAEAGSGLGLFLVRKIAEYHNGQVVYRDRDHGGARFIVSLADERTQVQL